MSLRRTMAKVMVEVGVSTLIAAFLVVSIFLLSLLPVGQRLTTPLETINGNIYTQNEGTVLISENLAHFDIKLREPVVAKKLILHFEYQPETVKNLAVGVRENTFWLSYSPQKIFQATSVQPDMSWHQATVMIPLTDKLQDTDRSVDAMFFANVDTDLIKLVSDHQEATPWQIRNVRAEVQYTWPSLAELKNYVKSVIAKERPI